MKINKLENQASITNKLAGLMSWQKLCRRQMQNKQYFHEFSIHKNARFSKFTNQSMTENSFILSISFNAFYGDREN